MFLNNLVRDSAHILRGVHAIVNSRPLAMFFEQFFSDLVQYLYYFFFPGTIFFMIQYHEEIVSCVSLRVHFRN